MMFCIILRWAASRKQDLTQDYEMVGYSEITPNINIIKHKNEKKKMKARLLQKQTPGKQTRVDTDF